MNTVKVINEADIFKLKENELDSPLCIGKEIEQNLVPMKWMSIKLWFYKESAN